MFIHARAAGFTCLRFVGTLLACLLSTSGSAQPLQWGSGNEGGSAPTLHQVVQSAVVHHPAVRRATVGVDAAAASRGAADGAFDLQLRADSTWVPLGYYDQLRLEVGATQPLRVAGASLDVEWRRGTGNIPSYYGEYRTLEWGEFSAGLKLPLLQDRRIDRARAAIRDADIRVAAAMLNEQLERLTQARAAASAWIRWTDARQKLVLANALLSLAEERQRFIESRVASGMTAPIDATDNLGVVAQRRAAVASALQSAQQASVSLSLFYRDTNGLPMLPDWDVLPAPPSLPDWAPADTDLAVSLALSERPDWLLLDNAALHLEIQRLLAVNSRLPTLDAGVGVSQDVGMGPADFDESLGPMTATVQLNFQMPAQQRTARFEAQRVALEADRLVLQRQQLQESFTAVFQEGTVGWSQLSERFGFVGESVDVARQLVDAERQRFEAGISTVFQLNLREAQLAAAIDAQIAAATEAWNLMVNWEHTTGRLDRPDLWTR
jgi:outer membrane protein TolC